MRLLIVEDNDRLAGLIAKLLIEHAFTVDRTASVDEAEAALAVAPYDLVLLDLTLPDGDGADILRQLRRKGHGTPVLVMTARADLVQRVHTLNEGADDYLVKPFAFDELLARVRALLRRPRQIADAALSIGNLTLDTVALTLTVAGAPVKIPRRELGVLLALLHSQGRLVAKTKLADAVYSFDQDVTPNAIEAVVSRLRRRLEAEAADVTITAMRGLGYVLTAGTGDAAG